MKRTPFTADRAKGSPPYHTIHSATPKDLRDLAEAQRLIAKAQRLYGKNHWLDNVPVTTPK